VYTVYTVVSTQFIIVHHTTTPHQHTNTPTHQHTQHNVYTHKHAQTRTNTTQTTTSVRVNTCHFFRKSVPNGTHCPYVPGVRVAWIIWGSQTPQSGVMWGSSWTHFECGFAQYVCVLRGQFGTICVCLTCGRPSTHRVSVCGGRCGKATGDIVVQYLSMFLPSLSFKILFLKRSASDLPHREATQSTWSPRPVDE
jgi:hypothetical protein